MSTTWMALGDEIGPQAAGYHQRRYNFPPPAPPPHPFDEGEIEYTNGALVKVKDPVRYVVIAGDPLWRERRYVQGGG